MSESGLYGGGRDADTLSGRLVAGDLWDDPGAGDRRHGPGYGRRRGRDRPTAAPTIDGQGYLVEQSQARNSPSATASFTRNSVWAMSSPSMAASLTLPSTKPVVKRSSIALSAIPEMSESASSAGLWRVAVEVPAALAAAVEAVLEPHVETMAVMEIGGGTATTLAPSATTPMVVEGFTQRQPDRLVIEAGLAGAMTSGAPPVLRIEDHGERDWLAENRASFPAIDVGRFHIRGSHLGAPPPPGRTVLRVDAAAAFGSGSHAYHRRLFGDARAAGPRPTPSACFGYGHRHRDIGPGRRPPVAGGTDVGG